MRKPRDGEATKAAILASAGRLFSERGFAGVSVDQVAKAAKVQRSLLLYHFGTKLNLWAAVSEVRIGRYLEHLDREIEAVPDEAFLRELVTRHFRFLAENPDLVRLSLWHKLEGVFAQLDGAAGANAVGRRLAGRFAERVIRLQRQGRLREDVSPENLFVAIMSLVEYWFQSQGMVAALAGAPDETDRLGERYLADVLRLFEQGMSAG